MVKWYLFHVLIFCLSSRCVRAINFIYRLLAAASGGLSESEATCTTFARVIRTRSMLFAGIVCFWV